MWYVTLELVVFFNYLAAIRRELRCTGARLTQASLCKKILLRYPSSSSGTISKCPSPIRVHLPP